MEQNTHLLDELADPEGSSRHTGRRGLSLSIRLPAPDRVRLPEDRVQVTDDPLRGMAESKP